MPHCAYACYTHSKDIDRSTFMQFTKATLSDLPEFHVGHANNEEAATGCTVVVSLEGAACSVDVRGGGPATRETDLLKPENMVEAVHAVVLSGGSAFGLEASTGVMQELAKRNIGFELCGLHVPIVVGACLFDLPYGKPEHPTAEMGAQATRSALDDAPVAEGNVGAGCGATVGKMLDPAQATKSGLGIYGVRCGDVVTVAIVAVNALGTVCLPDGTPLAGHRNIEESTNGLIMNPLDPVLLSMSPDNSGSASSESTTVSTDAASTSQQEGCTTPCTNTTIGVVLTNAKLTKAQCQKVSSITHDAYARTIKPVHTSADGDTIFTMASGKQEAAFDLVAIMATEAMQGAILRAAALAHSACGLPAAQDLNPKLCKQVLDQ